SFGGKVFGILWAAGEAAGLTYLADHFQLGLAWRLLFAVFFAFDFWLAVKAHRIRGPSNILRSSARHIIIAAELHFLSDARTIMNGTPLKTGPPLFDRENFRRIIDGGFKQAKGTNPHEATNFHFGHIVANGGNIFGAYVLNGRFP